MKRVRRLSGFKQFVVTSTMGTTLALGSCDLGEFESTSTVTLDGREVVSFLVRSWILTPIEDAITTGVDNFFDQIDDEDDD